MFIYTCRTSHHIKDPIQLNAGNGGKIKEFKYFIIKKMTRIKGEFNKEGKMGQMGPGGKEMAVVGAARNVIPRAFGTRAMWTGWHGERERRGQEGGGGWTEKREKPNGVG